MAHLFFSYAHADYDRLLPVFQRMELITERMIWIDRIGLQRDAEWAAMIERAIRSSYGVVFAVTKTFVERPFILDKEISWAIERFNDSRQGKLLFPILFDDVPLPTTLTGANVQFCKQVLDARDGNTERVIRELKSLLPEVPPSAGDEYPFVVSWPRLRNFKGRDQQLVELHHAMHTEDGKAGIKTAGMYGTGGIGKTQLAVEFVYRYRFYFPGGVFWINAARDWQSEVADCADHLGLKPIDPDDTNRNKQMALAFKQYRQASGQDALLVLDNVENPGDLATREIAPKLTILDLCQQTCTQLIVTTRVQTLPEGFARVEVSKLTPDDARAVLLDAWQGGSDTLPRTDPLDESTLDAMASLFDYLPLPLGWMAAALRQKPTLPPAKLLDNLRKQGVDETIGRLKKAGVALGTPAYYEALVGAGLDWQLDQVDDPNARNLLTLIAAYSEGAIIPAARLRRLADFPLDDLFNPFDEAVAALEKYSLIETQRGSMAFRLHPLEHAHLRHITPDYRAQLGEAARALLNAYRTPDELVHETLTRGFDAVLTDLRETQSAIPADHAIFGPLAELRGYFDWEAVHLRVQYPEDLADHDGGLYLIQHIRERAHHQGTDEVLRYGCDDWLEARRLPHFRTYDAWRHPHDPALLRVFEGHGNWVHSVAFAPDGCAVLSGSWDHTLRLWDVATGEELRRFEGHEGPVNAVAFTPDGHTALSGSHDKTLRLWDVATGEELCRFEGHDHIVNAVAFGPDGRTVLSGSHDKTLRLWDAATGEELRRFEGHSHYVTAVAFSPDGFTALSGSEDKTLRLWDVATGNELCRFESDERWGKGSNAVAFSPDGHTALSGSHDKTLRLWDVATGEELRRFKGHEREVDAIAFGPDGRTALSGSHDKTLRLWDVATGEELRRFEGHSHYVTAVAFSPDGFTALSGSEDKTLRLWNIACKAKTRYFEGHKGPVTAVAFAPDGHTALSGGDKTLQLWDITSGIKLRCFEGHHGTIFAFASDGHTALSGLWGNRTLILWNMDNGAELHRFRGHSDEVSAATYSPDGRTVLSGSWDRTLRLWDVARGSELYCFEGHNHRVTAVAFAPDGCTVLSGSMDHTLRLWDVASGAELHCIKGHSDWVTDVAFAPDGRTVLSGSRDGTLRLWEVATGDELRRFENTTASVAFAPDGRTILSCSWDKTLRLWNVSSGTLLAVLHLDALLVTLAVADSTPLSVVVGDFTGGIWVLRLYIPDHDQ